MKKLLSILVIMMFLVVSMPFGGNFVLTARSADTNKKATMIFAKFNPVGYDRDGKILEGKNFPWEPKGTNYWGRFYIDNPDDSYLMPFTEKAVNLSLSPVQVKTPGPQATWPLYWAEFYININAQGGKSQEYTKWYAVLDDAGQLWLDPDGQFNDPRYEATSDPSNSSYIKGSCSANVMARIDPIRSNNTQGPYMFDSNNKSYQSRIYFWDRNTSYKEGTDRSWRIGWINMPDYIRESKVKENDWEVKQTTWDPFSYKERPLSEIGSVLFKGTPVFNYIQPYKINLYQFSSDYKFYDANGNGTYDSDEYIYKKNLSLTPPNTDLFVEEGDFRYTPVSVSDGSKVYNYKPSDQFTVLDTDKDFKIPLTDFTATSDFVVGFADNIYSDKKYNIGEYIYRDYAPFGVVNIGDTRLTNVYIGGNYLRVNGNFSFAEIISAGDVLCLLEVLEASCDGSKYDISVETDIWEGVSPSTTAARFRSPNDEIPEGSGRIQKNTVLDPNGDKFAVPAATFTDIEAKYRSYIGIQVFRDNGVDNNRGVNLPGDTVMDYSLSDEYRPQRTCEEFLGATDGSLGIPDYGRTLRYFPLYVMYHDTGGEGYGCGETIYRKKIKTSNNLFVEAGDIRITDVNVDKGDNIVPYTAGSVVAEGDLDIGLSLKRFTTDNPSTADYDPISPDYYKFYDELNVVNINPENPASMVDVEMASNGEYDKGEIIYYDADLSFSVSTGDTRLTDGCEVGIAFDCGSKIEYGAEYYFNQSIPHMITLGQNGDPRYIDIEVIPGDLDINVDVDKPLKVEQTSNVKVSLGRELEKDEKVYVSAREPKSTTVPGVKQKLFDEALTDGGFIGYTPNMVDDTYGYFGHNMYRYSGSNYDLWGTGADGFKLGNTVYSRVCITEDGMLMLYNGSSPSTTPYPYYPYTYCYDYTLSRNYFYAGRPYPYSCGGYYLQYSSQQLDTYSYGYWNYYDQSGSSITYFYDRYKPYKDVLRNNTWIIPLGGQWHFPVYDGIYPYVDHPKGPGYYYPLPGYGVFTERNNSYFRVLWRVCTYPFTADENRSRGNNGVPYDPVFLAQYTSEFEVILYRSGLIKFNYGKVNIPTTIPSVYNSDNQVNPLTSPPPTILSNVPYSPIIGISDYYSGVYQLSKYSYGSSEALTNSSFLNNKSIIWKSPQPPDEGLYLQREFSDVKVIDRDNPVAEFQYTPYRGSCNDGNHGMDGLRAGTTLFNQFEIRAFLEKGGVKYPVPIDSDYSGRFEANYRDPFWFNSLFNKKEWQENYRKEPFFIIPPEPSPPLPPTLRNTYDCYSWIKLNIAPEELVIKPSKACLDLVSSRSPNISYTIYDADNPADVNDPANIEINFNKWFAGYSNKTDTNGKYDWGIDLDGSGSYGKPLIMNFNAHGAGIEYLFTALSGYGQKWQRYIVQVNSDGTYEFWRWFEADLPGQVFGALDQNDFLYTIRSRNIAAGGQNDPISGNTDPPTYRYKVPDSWRLSSHTLLEDIDCSAMLSCCDIISDAFVPFGDITKDDRYGFFGSAGKEGNPSTDPCANIPSRGNYSAAPSAIVTYGIPVVIMSPEDDFPGGMGLGVANPRNADTPLTIRLYSTNAIYDYNSFIKHPPYFTYDAGPGIDYLGYAQIKVLPADPVLNFSEMTIADRSLQFSKTNYTAGNGALSPLPPPAPQIKSFYDPVLHDWSDMTAYPGGQTHTGRTIAYGDIPPNANAIVIKKAFGRNAYPAIFKGSYHKLGTEFFPLTDYSLFFTLRDAEKNHYTFDPLVYPQSLILKRITIKGPFMLPKMYSEPDYKIDTSYNYQGLENVPIQYDTSGEIVIDSTNASLWEIPGINFNLMINPSRSLYIPVSLEGKNKFVRYNHSLYYGGRGSQDYFFEMEIPREYRSSYSRWDHYIYSGGWYTSPSYVDYEMKWYFYSPTARYSPPNYPYVPSAYNLWDCGIFAIEELIPTGPGKIEITVETSRGIKKIYQDCCSSEITDGITVDGIKVEADKKEVLVDNDNSVTFSLSEFNKKGDNDSSTYCNNAVLVAWQDRGAIDANTGVMMGAGDGWITNPPRSSDFTNIGTQYLPSDDINGNGKISFNDWETEILGSYDLATNTWTSGLIDARTFHKQNGLYKMEFTENNGNRIDTVGVDFGGLNLRYKGSVTPSDGIISDDECLPIIVSAYKYGDDNNDRGFTPFYNIKGEYPQYSHEVYSAGRTEITINAQNVYNVSCLPTPLTAGVQPELQDPTNPLTLFVTDETGAAVDLLAYAKSSIIDASMKEKIDDATLTNAIWNALFKDPHPEPLPQYYWLRTDLHNNDGTIVGNVPLYSNDKGRFEPIQFDISGSSLGKYVFKGFTANDAGSFDVYVYSCDRKKMGKATIKVQLPSVSYKVSNYDDPSGRTFDIPGDPDFVLTAGDNRIYKIKVSVKDAQGTPLKGVGQVVSVCGGSVQEVARFTPFVTTPANFYRSIKPWYWHYYGTGQGVWARDTRSNGQYSWYENSPVNWGDRWHPHIGVDLNNNGILEPLNNELERTRTYPYTIFYVSSSGSAGYFRTGGRAYYNTECIKYDDGTYATTVMFDTNSQLNPYPGWGLGCIYNRPYYTEGNYGMTFANLDKFGDDNGTVGQWTCISNTDSLNLDINGETEFYVLGEDVCEVGGLVGKNSWSISSWGDVAGSQANYTPTSPNYIKSRFGKKIVLPSTATIKEAYYSPKDYTYELDWDAMPSNVVKLRAPLVEPLNAEDSTPIGKTLLNGDAYDLIYGVANHIEFMFYPADKRDIPLKSDIMMILAGNTHEYRVSGRVDSTSKDPGDPAKTTMFVTPTGSGLKSISLDLSVKNLRKDMMRWEGYGVNEPAIPDYYYLLDLAQFDVVKGLNVEAITIDGPLSLNKKSNLKVIVTEIGTKAPIKGAEVSISGSGIKASKTTDDNGLCYFDVTPTKAQEALIITAKRDGYIDGKAVVDIGMSSDRKSLIEFMEIPVRTKNPEFELKGKVADDIVKVLVNGAPVRINEDRTFKATIILKEGFNTIVIDVEDSSLRTTRKIITIELKTTGPNLIIDDAPFVTKLVEAKNVTLTGKVDLGSTLEVNNILAEVYGNNFKVVVPLSIGRNQITFKASDELGNITFEITEIYNYTRRKVELIIGSNTARIDGNTVQIEEPPFIMNGRSYVPLRLISEAFGANVIWNDETKGITIIKDDKKIDMVIGSTNALVNDKLFELDAPPLIRGGLTFVPVRFVSEVLGGEITWNERIKLILIEFLI